MLQLNNSTTDLYRSYKMESIYVQDSLKLALEEMRRKQRIGISLIFYTSGSDT